MEAASGTEARSLIERGELTRGGSVESELSEFESEMIHYFVSFVQMLGLPRSVGQIYGLLFSSISPLTMNDIIARLGISKGSASQGLALLKSVGAVTSHSLDGDRREHYEADFQVSRIVQHFFQHQLHPRMQEGDDRIDIMLRHLGDDEEDELLGRRVMALKKWQKRGKQILPFLSKWLLKG